MRKNNIIAIKSKSFAIRSIRLYRYLSDEKHEYVLSRQLLKSGTSIGANVKEAIMAQSRPDFCAKLQIALKEANETAYWLEILHEGNYITQSQFISIHSDCAEILRLLTAILKTTRNNAK